MIFRNRIRTVLAAVSLLAFAACEEVPTRTTNQTPSGRLQFSYAGTDQGSFNAEGAVNRQNLDIGTYAVASRGTVQGQEVMVVLAQVQRTDGLFDFILLTVENPRTGEVTCTADQAEPCTFDALFVLGSTASGNNTDALYSSVGGTVRITSLNEDFAQGQFTLQMEDAVSIGQDETRVIQVTSGSFNVPVVTSTTR